ncbi:TetR/AcrR family transcriptional regulator [Bradyrhizobium sp.]|uniref:TetR/AcrR family transcriptional regulator n=1 Tax=Bradyrhizobium sp. TaxID=376 RepID=UPI002DDDB6E1|nr:TetR/AcrR family transcriptional regulator [Bradyrhizobium sp.]HEV2160557.1 TetR/AcrR family transcriptional regulator [Bradyrhizobium sp.]
MKRRTRLGIDRDEARSRILGIAEKHIRGMGYHKTTIANIASELGMSPANIYRFFRSSNAIKELICDRIINELVDIVGTIARTKAPATDRLKQFLIEVHHHKKMILVKHKHVHDLTVAATHENWGAIKNHTEKVLTLLESIIRDGIEAGEFEVKNAAEAARGVKFAFMPFFHPILLEQHVQHGDDIEADLHDQIRFVLRALRKSE